jgi:dTDP-4-dehydrorhamnose 3,5-epimerase
MNIEPTPLAGLCEIRLAPHVDDRGRFTRLFCDQELAAIRPGLRFPQINLSVTRQKGTVRGLHFQRPPAEEAKLIRCLRGRVFDVAVDLRCNSPDFLRWHAVELTEDNERAVFIPEGFAHGFQALTDDAQLLYMHTMPWTPECESGLRHDDPRLGITWPLPVRNLSARDMTYGLIVPGFSGIRP